MSDTKYYQLGGPTADGKDMINDVSWLILEAADRLNVTANLTVRVHDGLDEKFLRRSVELLFKHKNAWPRFSGDKSLVCGFMANGFSRDLACARIAVGCNWMAIPGIEYGLCDSIKINFAKIFEVAFYELSEQQNPSVDKLWRLFKKHLNLCLDTVFKTTDFHLKTNRFNSPELFLNLFCKGPIEKGRDASDHSLDYYNISIDGAGIAVAADSFAALQQRVETEKKMTWLQIINSVRSNYSSLQGKKIQAYMKTAEKFGQFNSLGGKWAVKISKVFTERVCAGKSEEGARFIPGLFSWSKTILFGQNVGATPDGREAGTAINHGANPMPGSIKNGEMTAMSEAIASVQCYRGNTAPFQIELDPYVTEAEDGVSKILSLFKIHLEHGGTLINVNIIDSNKILAAHKNPELFPDLVVRVTGFTSYFISLSPEFRQLVVDRIMEAN
jgi:formate C-acetyltransferase